jgi:U2-associated protein SR140
MVNPDELEKQAVTTSKWDFFDEYNSNDSEPKTKEQEESKKQQHQDFINETKQLFNQLQEEKEQLSCEKRQFLRDIEIKAVEYQDELETGKAERNKDISIKEQVESYRHYLFRKGLENSSNKERQRSKSRSPYSRRSTSSSGSSYKKKQKSRSRSNSPNSKRYKKKSRY